MESRATPTPSLASLTGPGRGPSRGAIGVVGNGGVSAGSASPSVWTPSPASDLAFPSPGADVWTRERPPGAAASPTAEPAAGNLHGRDCAGGAG